MKNMFPGNKSVPAIWLFTFFTLVTAGNYDVSLSLQKLHEHGYRVIFKGDSLIEKVSPNNNHRRLYDIRQNMKKISADVQIIDLTKADPDDYKELFVKTNTFPISGANGYPVEIADFDGDGFIEFAGSYKWYNIGSAKTAVFELDNTDAFIPEKIYQDSNRVQSPISLCDADNDGLSEYNFRGGQIFVNYQSPSTGVLPDSSRFTYTTWEVSGYTSSETFGQFDGDGQTDLIHTGADTVDGVHRFKIYVAEFDSALFNFRKIFSYGPSNTQEYISGISAGDIDGDGKMEFVTGSIWGSLFFFENMGDNHYELIRNDTVSANNLYVNVHTRDMDGNGKEEFILGGSYWTDPGGTIFYWIESDGDNSYKVVRKFIVAGADPLGYSEAWAYDVNNDGYDDLVLHYSYYVAILTWNRNTQQFDLIYMRPWTYEVQSISMYDTNKIGVLDLYVSVNEYDKSPSLKTHLYKNDFISGVGSHFPVLINNFFLLSNYPNPFNGTTTIPFKLKIPGNVTLYVTDITGRKIKTLIRDEKYRSGSYTVRWNGVGDNGKEVSSGVYIVILQNGAYKQSRKILLIK